MNTLQTLTEKILGVGTLDLVTTYSGAIKPDDIGAIVQKDLKRILSSDGRKLLRKKNIDESILINEKFIFFSNDTGRPIGWDLDNPYFSTHPNLITVSKLPNDDGVRIYIDGSYPTGVDIGFYLGSHPLFDKILNGEKPQNIISNWQIGAKLHGELSNKPSFKILRAGMDYTSGSFDSFFFPPNAFYETFKSDLDISFTIQGVVLGYYLTKSNQYILTPYFQFKGNVEMTLDINLFKAVEGLENVER